MPRSPISCIEELLAYGYQPSGVWR
jgi:hypothetical protein